MIIDLSSFDSFKIFECISINHPDLKAVNSLKNPNNIKPVKNEKAHLNKKLICVELPIASWNMIRLVKK